MKEQLNSGVRCNVKTCVYNEDGCNCNKDVIDVSQGDGKPASRRNVNRRTLADYLQEG